MRNKLIVIVSFIALCFTLQVNGQQHSNLLSMGYYGNNLLNPGLEISYSNLVHETPDEFRNYAAIHLDQSLAFYRDFGNHIAFLYTAGISRNKVKGKNYKWTFGVKPIGIYRSILPRAYEVDTNGNIVKLGVFAGNWYYSPGISATYSRLNKKNELGRFYVKGEILALVPFNTFVVPLLNIGMGYQLDLKKNDDEK